MKDGKKRKEMYSSPKVTIPSKEEFEKMGKNVDILVLTTGHLVDGSAFFAYVSIPPNKYLDFKLAEESGNYDLTDYGEIITYGKGLEPPPEVIKEMREKYSANPNFEKEIMN